MTRPKSLISLLLRTLLTALMGLVLGAVLVLGLVVMAMGPGPGGMPAALGCVAFNFVLMVGGHELGHLLAGLAARFRPWLVVVAPFRVYRHKTGYRWGLNRPLFRPVGLVAAVPLDDRHLRRRLALFIAGGPAASLLLAAACLAGALLVDDLAPRPPRTVPAWWLASAAFANLCSFGFALLPARSHGMPTDGAQLLDLMVGGARADRHVLVALLSGASARGVRPRDWDAAQLGRLLETRDGSEDDAATNLLGYYHALDSGQVDRAGELLELALKQRKAYPALLRPQVFAEAAFFGARYRGDVSEARFWLARLRPGEAAGLAGQRAGAAVLLAEGKTTDAAARVVAAMVAAAQSPDLGGALAERDWLEAILDECVRIAEERQAAETTRPDGLG
jgi:hypothetical protein